MEARSAVVVASLLVLAAGAPAGVAAAQSSGDRTIERTVTMSLTPSMPGWIDVTVRYDLPDGITSFQTGIPQEAVVTGANGFERASHRRYAWTGGTATPSVSFTLPVNESSTGGRAQIRSPGGQYEFVDAGPWALFRLPRMGAEWSWTGGGSVDTESSYRAAGEGFVGSAMAYLGPHEVHARTTAGQTFSLVVPSAADPAARPAAVLDSLGAASRSFRVGDRDPRVNFFVAPATVSWGAHGLQYGDTDAWVHASAELDSAGNTYLHEYVHTRQEFATETEMRWVTEASAEYYAALMTLSQGRIGYDAFRSHLARGTNLRYASTILADPTTWAPGAQYLRGSLVVGAVDRRMRLATDAGATFEDVVRELNTLREPVSGPDYEAVVRRLAGDRVAALAVEWARTSQAPSTWSRAEHRRAFGPRPATFDVTLGGDGPTYRVTGPYGTRTAARPPTLYPGETLTVSLGVTNVGDVPGGTTLTLTRNGTVVDEAAVELASGASTAVPMNATFEGVGAYTLVAGLERVSVRVAEPGPVSVTRVSANRTTVRPGEQVSVTATVRAGDRPSRGTVAVAVDGEVVDERTVTLAAGAGTAVTRTVTFETAGEHAVRIGDRTVTVTVSAATPTPTPTPTEEAPGTPGFGVGAALAAGALAALALGRR